MRTFQHLNTPHIHYRSAIYLPRKAHHHQEQSVKQGATESDDSAAPQYLKGSAMRANLSCLRCSYPSRERGPLEGFSFFEVFEICVTRELDADVHGNRAELKSLSSGCFILKLWIDSIHNYIIFFQSKEWLLEPPSVRINSTISITKAAPRGPWRGYILQINRTQR